jgi:hypothetical protein
LLLLFGEEKENPLGEEKIAPSLQRENENILYQRIPKSLNY